MSPTTHIWGSLLSGCATTNSRRRSSDGIAGPAGTGTFDLLDILHSFFSRFTDSGIAQRDMKPGSLSKQNQPVWGARSLPFAKEANGRTPPT